MIPVANGTGERHLLSINSTLRPISNPNTGSIRITNDELALVGTTRQGVPILKTKRDLVDKGATRVENLLYIEESLFIRNLFAWQEDTRLQYSYSLTGGDQRTHSGHIWNSCATGTTTRVPMCISCKVGTGASSALALSMSISSPYPSILWTVSTRHSALLSFVLI